MIKPKNRKRLGISAFFVNVISLAYTLYTQQTELAKLGLIINASAILLWFTSEGFLEFLIAKYLNGKKYE